MMKNSRCNIDENQPLKFSSLLSADQEKENILIATSEELHIALTEMQQENRFKDNQLYKLYIVVQNDDNNRDANAKKPERSHIHPGVICDVCEQNIYGFRFKCMQCADYDLCDKCMSLGYHPEHYMVRMIEPVDFSGHHGQHLVHHMRKFVRKMQHTKNHQQKCSRREKQRCSSSSNNGGDGSCPIYNAKDSKYTVGPCDALLNSMADVVVDICMPSLDECPEEKNCKEQRRDPSTEAATEATEKPQRETKDKFTQLIKMLEENLSGISQFLDPLGINVNMVDERHDASKTEPQKSSESTSASENVKKFPGTGKKLCDDGEDEKAPLLEQATPTPKEAAAVAGTSCSTEQAAEAEEWTMVQRESPTLSHASSTSSSVNGAIPKQVSVRGTQNHKYIKFSM